VGRLPHLCSLTAPRELLGPRLGTANAVHFGAVLPLLTLRCMIRLGCCLLALLLAATPLSRAQGLRAGVARVDITPPAGLPLQGYGGSERTATGTRDPLFARILVLEAGTARLALVDLDLIATFEPPYLDQLRAATRQDVPYLLVAAIHTHSGPPLIPGLSPAPQDWESQAVGKVARAIHEATSHLVPARLGVGYGVAYIGHNRLLHHRDGEVTWLEPNWTGIPTAPLDPTVVVVRVDSADGAPLAILANYACHPVIYGPDSRLYSADFPGVMASVVEKAFGNHPLCFFLQGGDGDINPHFAVTPLQQGAVELCERTGTELGGIVAQVARRIQTEAEAQPSLRFAMDYLTFGPRWDRRQWEAEEPRNAKIIELGTQPEYRLPVTTALLGQRIAIAAMPGEPFVDFQMQWRARCPVRDCLFLGYTNGYFGYFPTLRAATWGGYGASHPSTVVEVGAGEQMLNQALIRAYEMLGRLKALPEDLHP
jgi:neutral ceramidase